MKTEKHEAQTEGREEAPLRAAGAHVPGRDGPHATSPGRGRAAHRTGCSEGGRGRGARAAAKERCVRNTGPGAGDRGVPDEESSRGLVTACAEPPRPGRHSLLQAEEKHLRRRCVQWEPRPALRSDPKPAPPSCSFPCSHYLTQRLVHGKEAHRTPERGTAHFSFLSGLPSGKGASAEDWVRGSDRVLPRSNWCSSFLLVKFNH